MIAVLEGPAREDKRAITGEKVRALARANNNTTATLLRLWRTGVLSLAETWADGGGTQEATPEQAERVDLARRMREATSDGDRTTVLLEASARALELDIPAGLLQALTGALNAARQSHKEARAAEPPPQEIASLLPATAEAIPLIEAFESITGEARRKLVIEFAREQLERDRLEGPKAITARDAGAKEAG